LGGLYAVAEIISYDTQHVKASFLRCDGEYL